MGANESRRFLAVVTALILTAGLAACGGTSASDDAADGLGFVAAAVEDARTVAFAFGMEMEIMGTALVMEGEGVSDVAAGVSAITITGAGDLGAMLGENEIRYVDESMYVRGAMAQQFSPGTVVPDGSWVELPNVGATANLSNQAAGADFGQLLAMLEVAGEVESTGQTTIDGVTVDGYRTMVTSRDLLAAQGMNEEEVVEAMLATQPGAVRDALSEEQVAELTGMLDLEQDFQVWVDADDLPRRVITTIDDFGEMVEAAMTMQYDILAYGVDVDVQPPPADQVVIIE